MAYGSGFANNLPAWKPLAVQTPPIVPSNAAPGPITDYNANQLRMLNHSEPAPMPAGGAARPPVSQQVPINNSVGQMTPRSAGIGGATSPNQSSLTNFEKFLRPNTAFTPQATVNTPGLVEGMANTPRSMGPLFSGSIPPSAYSTYLSSGGVLPPEAPKPVVNMAMSGNPGSTVGYSMGGGQPPRSPGAPFAVPPSGGGGDMGGSMEEARNLSRAAGIVGAFAKRTPVGALAAISGPSIYHEAMDPHSEFGATWRNAGESISDQPSFAGKVGATLAATPFVIGTGIKAGLRPFVKFADEAFGAGSKAYAAPAAAAAAPGRHILPPVDIGGNAAQPPAAQPGVPHTVTVGPQDQSLTDRYPDRFKHVPGFGQVLNGGANSGRAPLSPQEQAYNAEVMRGLQLENRSRELANVDRYRATQLHDRNALATLQATHGGHPLGHQLEREQVDPSAEHNKVQGMREASDALNEKRNAVHSALFDQSIPEAQRLRLARQRNDEADAFAEMMGLKDPRTFEERIQAHYGVVYDPKTGTFKKPR